MNETNVLVQEEVKEKKTYLVTYFMLKRFMDIIGGLIGGLLTLPIIFVVKIICLKDGDKNPIIFKQERIGKDGGRIIIYKFRTMIPNADEELKKLLKRNKEAALEYKRYKKLKDDPRITKVGKFLRKTSIDEFPQFFNVLKGDMSLVGPRPYLFREKEDMGEYFDLIIKCKPGVTGYWQVNGRSNTDFARRLVLDEYYYNHRTTIMDLKIVVKTIRQVIFKEGF